MLHITVRFYAELNDFLPSDRQGVPFTLSLERQATIKDVIEAVGVPHTEVDLILVNGVSVDFTYRVQDGDHISVYPVFESLDISPIIRLRPQPLRETRFVLDVHLGKLAVYLRVLGFDTLYRNDSRDEELAQISATEHRILLTRDLGLLKRSMVTHGYYVRATDPQRQVVEVVRRFDLASALAPFRRCPRCNTPLEHVEKEAIIERLLPKTRLYYDEFRTCPTCGAIYWRGSHHSRMQALVERVRAAAR